MKSLSSIQAAARPAPVAAFTLVEMMSAMFIFVVLLVAGMIAVQIFTLKMSNFTTDKLMATNGSTKAMNQICDEIRSAQFLRVGNFASSTFTPIANGSSQQGNALEVFPSLNTGATPPTYYTNIYSIYYLNTANKNLYFITNGMAATSSQPGILLASWITNTPCFWSENFQGTVNTSTNTFANMENCTIRMVWYFRQYGAINATTAHEFYTIMARATPRGPIF